MLTDIDYLRTVHIERLQRAARAAGLAWKSGTLSKADIVDRLGAYPSMCAAAVALLKREDAGGTGRPTFKPAAPKPPVSLADWTDGEPGEARPIPVVRASSAEPMQSVDLGAYALKTDVRELAERTDQRMHATVRAVADLNAAMVRENAALRAEVADLKAMRPLVVNIEGRKPHKVEGVSHRQLPDLLAWLETIGRVILTGPAGTGKSRGALQCAEALGLEFHLQTPFTQAYEYLGHRDAQGVFHETPTFQAYTRGGVLLMDEADSSSPDAFLAANPILDGNGFAMFGDGKLHRQHEDFRVILNMNTQGDGASMAYSGRNPLDGATIARFGGMLHWTVDPLMEKNMSGDNAQFYEAVLAVRRLMTDRAILTVNATPRHTMIGAKLLANPHFAQRREFILESCLKNGAVAEVWSDVLRLPAVQQFLGA